MRLLPIVPIILSIVALILAFLCLFAGSKPNFLESYSILNLNVSRIGQNTLNTSSSSSSSSSNPLTSFFHNITDPLVAELQGDLNSLASSIAKDLGLQDFYSVHIMDYCHGFYTPGPVENATVKHISRNVTGCSNRTAMFAFDPTAALEKSLNDSGLVGNQAAQLLDKIDWPADLQKGLQALRAAFKAQFVMYCIAIAFTVLTLLAAAVWMFTGGRLGATADIVLAFLAFLFMGIASALSTAIAIKGSNEINKYGKDIGVSSNKGSGFMGMTWAATACLFVATVVGCVGCFGANRKRQPVRPYNGEKS